MIPHKIDKLTRKRVFVFFLLCTIQALAMERFITHCKFPDFLHYTTHTVNVLLFLNMFFLQLLVFEASYKGVHSTLHSMSITRKYSNVVDYIYSDLRGTLLYNWVFILLTILLHLTLTYLL